MIIKSTYFACDEKDSYDVKKQIITYFFCAGKELFKATAKTGGNFDRIYFLNEDGIFRMMRLSNERDILRAQDYNIIKECLDSFGKKLRETSAKENNIFYLNEVSNTAKEHNGCRKLKNFEEK
jgi:hypothetical protein